MKNLMPFILILVAIGVFFLLFDPQYKEVQSLQEEIEQNDETLALATKLRKERDLLRDRYKNISDEERLDLLKLLPDTVDNVRLIIDINNIAAKYNIPITEIEISSEEEGESTTSSDTGTDSEFADLMNENPLSYADTSKIGVISFSFSVSAQYDVFLEFLKDLEDSLRLIDIRSVDITRSSEEEVFYNYRVNFDTYWLK